MIAESQASLASRMLKNAYSKTNDRKFPLPKKHTTSQKTADSFPFSDMQRLSSTDSKTMDLSSAISLDEGLVLRPKLLKQQKTEETPPSTPNRAANNRTSILKNGRINASSVSGATAVATSGSAAATSGSAAATSGGISMYSGESFEIPNADGKFNDQMSPSMPTSRRRSVFIRLKTLVLRSHSFEESVDSGKI